MNYSKLYTLRSDGRYMGYWHDADGKRHAVYDTDPERLHDKIEAKEKGPQRTFGKIAEEWKSLQLERIESGDMRTTTWKNYLPHYEDIVGRYRSAEIEDIDGRDIKADLDRAKAQGYSRTVVNTIRVVWNGIFSYACGKGYTGYNPVSVIPLPKKLKKGKRREPTEEETEIILSHKESPFDIYIYMLLCTGMRKSEGLALTKGDIDFGKRIIHLRHALEYINHASPRLCSPKTEAGIRDIQIVDILYPVLADYCRDKKNTDILFPASASNRNPKANGYISIHQFERLWRDYRRAYGLPEDLTVHCLRHGTATLLFESGVDVHTAKDMLGHANIQTTVEIYEGLRTKQRQKSLDKFNASMSALTDGIRST